jgi:hypothetical protein
VSKKSTSKEAMNGLFCGGFQHIAGFTAALRME